MRYVAAGCRGVGAGVCWRRDGYIPPATIPLVTIPLAVILSHANTHIAAADTPMCIFMP